MKYYFILFVLFLASNLHANNYTGQIHQFKQPDGSVVDVRLYGNEFYMRAESIDGYTLYRASGEDYICYARLSEDGQSLESTGIVYKGRENDLGSLRNDINLPKHIDLPWSVKKNKIDSNVQNLMGMASYEELQASYQKEAEIKQREDLKGHLKGLCIIVDFSDEPGTVEMPEFEKFVNQLDYNGYGNKGSLRSYYWDMSAGLLDYENVVFGYFRAPRTFKYYDGLPYATGARLLLNTTLNKIEEQGFDFSTLSINPDGTIMAINLMYTGAPPVWAEGMWHHQGFHGEFSADGVQSGRYNTSPAYAPLTIGTIVHENGHMICKWPDTYKYNSDTGPDGIGAFDVMCGGGHGTNPVPANPYFMNRVGWTTIYDVTDKNITIKDTASVHKNYIFRNKDDDKEFFIFQNRVKTGRSLGIPAEGLTIWHILETGNNQTTTHQVYLEHANNNNTVNTGAPFKKYYNEEFSDTTLPNANWYYTGPSGLRVWDISESGVTMTYKIGRGSALNLSNARYQNDSNDNNILEQGEEFEIVVDINNLFDIDIENAIVSIHPYGPYSDLLVVLSDDIKIDFLEAHGKTTATFKVKSHESLPLFALMTFKLVIENDDFYDDLNFEAFLGQFVIMDDQNVTTCNALFLDPNGQLPYAPNLHHIQTFYPEDPTDKLKVTFEDFILETSGGCRKDYLAIYNGPDVSSPLFGKYCGKNIPPEIISTHDSGALTFEFVSSEEQQFDGWKAYISCLSTLETIPFDGNNSVSIFPNPVQQLFYISLSSPGNYTIDVHNSQGQRLHSLSTFGQPSHMISTSDWTQGIYYVTVRSQTGVITKKIIVL